LLLNPPARVLMTADCVGGVWTYALDLSRALAGAGVEVTLAVLGPSPSPAQGAAAGAIDGLTLIDTGLPLDWLAQDAEAVLQTGRAVAALAREVRADLVHLNSPALAACGAFVQPVVGACHSCLKTWWDAVKGGRMPADFLWRTQLLKAGYEACAVLIAPSRAFAEATAHAYGGATPQTVLNGRAGAPAPSADRRQPQVITAGRLWDEGKNLAVLDQAAAGLSAPVLAAGPLAGPQGQTTEVRHVEALGALDPADLSARLADSPVFASVALYEPFGLTALEAAQAGCALVLSDIPTFRELWQGAALFVDPREPDAVAEVLERLLADPARCARVGAAARERAGRYTVEAMAAATLAAYAAAQAAQQEAAA
jgi:glycogen(starch) synthase